MKKVSALFLILLMLGPTVAMACSCCPTAASQAPANFEISAADCCCHPDVVQQNATAADQVANSNLIFIRDFLTLSSLAYPSKFRTQDHAARSHVALDLEQSPHHLKDIPLYLSNLVLRF